MKKFLACFVALILCATAGIAAVFAADYEVSMDEANNLAVNPYNWHQPTVSNAVVEFTEEGIHMESFTANQNAVTVYAGARTGEFRLQMYVNAHLNVPSPEMADWCYSNLYITFLIDRDPQETVAESAVPWYSNDCYLSLGVGLDSGGKPRCQFLSYNAFSNNCSTYDYVGKSSDINIADGQKHWIEIDCRNFETETDSGKKLTAYIDGVEAASYTYYDDIYYDAMTRQEYEVNISKITGCIGIYATSDWPAGISASRMDNYIDIEKLQVIAYDNSEEGEYFPQLTEPEYEIKAIDYVTQAKYDVGELIEIKLTDLFQYEGTKEVTYTVTADGAPIGAISNGFWAWTPETAGNYDVTFEAVVEEDNAAVNYLTLRVKGDGDEANPPEEGGENEPDGNSGKENGCGSSMGIGCSLSSVLLLSVAAAVMRKKQL